MGAARRPAPPARRPAPAQSRPASTQASTPAPMASHPPATQSSGGGMLSGIGSTIAQGMAFGTGSAIAHRAVGAVAGSMGGGGAEQPVESAAANTVDYQQPMANSNDVCSSDKQMFYECLQMNKNDQSSCSFLYDQLKQCQAQSTSMSFQ